MAHGIVAVGYTFPDGTTKTGTKTIADIVSGGTYNSILLKLTNGRLLGWQGNGRDGINSDVGIGGLYTQKPTFLNFQGETGTLVNAYQQGLHGAALFSTGNLYTWGDNTGGILGTGDTTHRNVPTLVVTGTASVLYEPVTTGYDQQYTRIFYKSTTDGHVYGVGHNSNGGLGAGTAVNQTTFINSTSTVTGFNASTNPITGFWAFGGSWGFNFLQLQDGNIWASGYNGFGQLGDSTQINRTAWVNVSTAWGGTARGAITRLVGGSGYYDTGANAHGYATMLRADGTVWSSGARDWGSVGDTVVSSTPRTAPSNIISSVTDIAAIGGGPGTVFFITSAGAVMSVGHNPSGQAGLGHTTSTGTITTVTTTISNPQFVLRNFNAQTYSYRSSMFIRNSVTGDVYATGRNNSGQLGLGSTSDKSAFTIVPGLNGVTKITCAGFQDATTMIGLNGTTGKISTWGYNGRALIMTSHTSGNYVYPLEMIGYGNIYS